MTSKKQTDGDLFDLLLADFCEMLGYELKGNTLVNKNIKKKKRNTNNNVAQDTLKKVVR